MNSHFAYPVPLSRSLNALQTLELGKVWSTASKTKPFILEDRPKIRENSINTLEKLASAKAVVGSAQPVEEGVGEESVGRPTSKESHWDLAIRLCF